VLIVALALVFGVSAAVGVNVLLENPPGGTEAGTVPVVVAATDIDRGTTVTPDLIKTRACPKDLVPAGAVSKAEDVVGRVAYIPLVKDEAVLDGKLASKGSGRGMAALTLKGMRTVTIQTPDVSSGVAGFILPGNKVDVLLTVKDLGHTSRTGGASTTRLLQNVEIVAVDQRLSAPSDNKVDVKELRSVTLLVTPNQDAMLALAQTMGTLHLSLRNSGDGNDANTQPVTLADLRLLQEKPKETKLPEVDKKAPPPPKPARPRPLRIRLLRGTQESIVTIRRQRTDSGGR
jgi:pilus assembly protein CpaB